MKRIPLSLLLTAALLIASVALAGAGDGPFHKGTIRSAANGPNGMFGGFGDGRGKAMQRTLVVGSDDTAYVIHVDDATTPAEFAVAAVRPSGAVAWTVPVGPGATSIHLSGALLLVATHPVGFSWQQPPAEPGSEIRALSTASGIEQWTVQLDGFVFDIEPFSGGTYVLVAKPGTAPSCGLGNGPSNPTHPCGTLQLVGIGNDGSILWSHALRD